ncbi:contractile injection system tape measure protein [Flavivirga abyssicola]|uniref:contractile injection system tape measure protein n=1 Tax=Flavivirga abyssicola TaxID=3063533 RepID=UPI0026E094A1|nr:contractile injection system tape measure protein [Flavivirga sp. MEBiC07777]WVK12626.1 contractile injection system tape measure protein [Flavivirga sp. MEBiC07777]
MKDTQTHIIKSQQYEIELHDASQGYEYQSRVSQLQEHGIQVILQKVMDTYHATEYLDQYDEVVLDLGTISESNFDRELGYKIEEAFIDFFKNNTYDNGSLIRGKRKPIHKTKIDQFVFFLKNGYLQWDTPSSTKPLELLTTALRNNKEALIAILKKEGQKETIRKRLISQLKDTALEQIVIAIKNEEGVYINQSRRDIIQYQENNIIVEVNKGYFRNAIWEIILTYIFVEVTGYSNQTNFLKYLIRKIATKYNLTYKNLLTRIVLGIKNNNDKIGTMPNLGKIVTTLLEEVEKGEMTFKKTSKENKTLDFIDTLNYYFEYNALPVTSTITTLDVFSKNIEDLIQTNPTEFYTVFYKFIEEDSNINRFTSRFSSHLVNSIVTNASDEVFITIAHFFKQMITISNRLSIQSMTLNRLQKLFGKIAWHTYAVIRKTPSNSIREFLYQTVRELIIDQEFIIILKAFEKEKGFKSYKDVSLFVKDITVSKNSTGDKQGAIFSKFSEKLFAYYKGKTPMSLKEFQINLAATNYKEVSFKLMIILLDLTSKDKNSSKQSIIGWLSQRLTELDSKVNPIELILSQMHKMAKVLLVDKKMIQAIDEAKGAFLKNNKIEIASLENGTTGANQVPLQVYQELVEAIKNRVYNRTQQDFYNSIEELLELFSKKYNVERNRLLEVLKKNNTGESASEFLKIIFEHINSNKQKASNKRGNNDRFDLDSVQYFFIYGRLPWWVKSKSTALFQKSMYKVLSIYPEQFVVWFKKSKNQKVILDLMDHKTYNVFIKQINASVTQSVIATKQLFTTLLDKDLSGIKNILPAHHKAIQYMLLEYIQSNQQIDISKLTAFIVHKLEQIIAVSKEDLYQLLLSRMRYDKQLFKTPKNLESWLQTEIKHTAFEYKDVIQKIEDDKPWRASISFSNAKEVIEALEIIYKNKPQELMYHLKRLSFRKGLISKLSVKNHRDTLKLFFPVADRSQLLTVFEIFKNLKKQITTKNYQIVWSCFIDKLLLKIAMHGGVNWSINDWSLLLYESISTIKHSNSLKELIPEILVNNNITSEKIANEIERIVAQKEEVVIKQESSEEVPEVIEKETVGESVFIENAGMVILGPYIPMLFERMKLMENKAFKNDVCQQKAVYILQYAATGKTEFEEHALVLNKIICGMDIHTPIESVMTLNEEEKKLIDGLLEAIIAHWSTIGNTSVDGLRTSFLCREGRVTIEEKKYVLVVEEKSYDMLLDNIPWTIGQLKLSWMEKFVEVIWRA